jgi:hypothetical protein
MLNNSALGITNFKIFASLEGASEEESASGSKRTDPEYRHTLSEIRRKLERGFEELALQEHAVLKNFLTGQLPKQIKETSASNRTKIKQKAFKKLRKYISLHFDMKELLDFIAD